MVLGSVCCAVQPETTERVAEAQVASKSWSVTKNFTALYGTNYGESVALSKDGQTLLVAESSAACVGAGASSPCCVPQGAPECGADPGITQCVCAQDSFCCNVTWDSICAREVSDFGCGSCAENCGAVHVYVQVNGDWQEQATLTNATPHPNSQLGGDPNDDRTLALSGDGNIAVVSDNAGSAWIFTRSGTAWTEQQHLTEPVNLLPPGVSGAAMQYSPSISDNGNVVVVGARFAEHLKGAAYVFERKGTQWQATARLVGSDTVGQTVQSSEYSEFGESAYVSPDGATVVVGAPGVPARQKAYVFKHHSKSWSEAAILTPSALGPFPRFGAAVTVSNQGDTIAVGELSDDGGQIHVYQWNGNGWSEEAILGPNLPSRSRLGFAIDIDDGGNTIVAGDWGAGHSWAFDRAAKNGVVTWTPQLLVDGPDLGVGDGVGSSMAISGNGKIAVVSTPVSRACSGGVSLCGEAVVLNR
jgi:hypothetical protein